MRPLQSPSRITLAIASLTLAASLTAWNPQASAAEMQFVGDLRKIATNSLKGSAPLADVLAKPHTYGLGMLDGLDAELLVLDSVPYLGGFTGDRYKIVTPGPTQVAFGGFASVAEWDSVAIPANVSTFADLQTFIGAEASRRGFDLNTPVPFCLEASATHLAWFVVDGMGDLQPTPRESFVRRLRKGRLENVSITTFGFYSDSHRGIYTNPRSSIHTHFRTTRGEPFVAHLDDDIELVPGGQLLLPRK